MIAKADVLTLEAAALIAVTVTIHSLLGERRLIGPMLAIGGGVLDNSLARGVVRFAWHLTTAIGLTIAAVLVATVVRPDAVRDVLLLATGLSLTVGGLIDAVMTRGRHIGWPFLTATGLACFGAYLLG